jgi:S-disulfanyl-L-cysteine oxidoreductase SoxD
MRRGLTTAASVGIRSSAACPCAASPDGNAVVHLTNSNDRINSVQPYVRSGSLVVAVVALLAADGAAAQSESDSARSVLEGAYTSAQAARGQDVFRSTCGNCHSSSQFTGPAFEVVWDGRPVFEFFDQLRSTMPLDNPGGLSREEYANVIAYILKLNAYPAGDAPLPADDAALKRIRIDRKPQPASNR